VRKIIYTISIYILAQEQQHDRSWSESEENSLSISLPSEGSQRNRLDQLSHVRTGILKIFSDDEESHLIPSAAAAAAAAADRSFAGVDDIDGSSTFDPYEKFNEKHEFETNEKMKTSVILSKGKVSTAAWSSEDMTEDQGTTPIDNDSGIDRDGGAASRVSGGSGKVWTKIHKQLNRRFGGSTGSLSSASPVSDQDQSMRKGSTGELYSKGVAQMGSPREGTVIHCLLTYLELHSGPPILMNGNPKH
jgi:hypothetical protein